MAALDGAIPAIIGAANAAGGGDLQIERSLRFNTGDSAYLNRTPSSASADRTIWTLSFWIKICEFSLNKQVFTIYSDGSNDSVIRINGNNYLEIYNYRSGSYQTQYISNAQFRDPSAWYHFVVSANGSTSLNAWVNGEAVTWSTSSGPNGVAWLFNNTENHQIGRYNTTANSNFYLADVNWIDGQALAETDFGAYDDNNVWQPKAYSGAYGTNGFYLKFADNSSVAALGTDSSGNSNTFTVNNISLGTSAKVTDYLTHTGGSVGSGAFNSAIGSVSSLGSYSGDTWTATNTGWVDTWDFSADTDVTSFTLSSWSVGSYSNQAWYFSNDSSFASAVVGPNSGTIANGTHSLEVSGVRYRYCRIQNVPGATYSIVGNGSTPGAGADSLIDTPTNYEAGSGNNGGNYCTLSPLKNSQTLSNGNLDVVGGSSWQRSVGTIGMYSGKYYWEYTITASNEHLIGVGPPDMQLSGNLGAGSPPGSGYGTELGFVNGTGANGSWSNTGASGAGDVIAIAFDADNGNMYVYKNGSALNGGIASHTGLVMPQIPVVSLNGSSRSGVINFGQRPFKYTPPTGYVSLCTTNLTDPAIADPSTEFDTTLYSGNDAQRDITGLGFSPDFVWIKKRNGSSNHSLMDTVRGATKNLVSNDTQAEGTEPQYLNAFLSDGFSLGTSGVVNDGSSTYVAWAWEASDTTTTVAKDANGTNLPGATCEYRANTTNGFSVVKVADPQSNEARVHGLNVAPDFFICKSTASADSWHTYWKVLGRSYYINLNGTGPASSSDQFGSQEPDSTYFYVKSNTGSGANKSGGMVYYLWSAVDQYSAFGEYLGNANADGPFVFTGFRPKWILFKMRSGSGNWRLMDTSRDLINPCDAQLYPDNTDAESSSTAHEVDYLSNGFKVVTSHPAMNSSGQYYLYAAFAENPFKTSRAR